MVLICISRIKSKLIFVICLIFIVLSGCSSNIQKDIEISEEINDKLLIPNSINQFAIDKKQTDSIIEKRSDRKYDDLPTPSFNSIIIDDSNYLTRIDNIKRKINEYQNKTITIEGMYAKFSSWDDTFSADIVYKNGPNDYNNDIWGGFFLNDLKGVDLEIDDYIKVVGTPYIYETIDSEGTNYSYLYLDVISIDKLAEKRGTEFVIN